MNYRPTPCQIPKAVWIEEAPQHICKPCSFGYAKFDPKKKKRFAKFVFVFKFRFLFVFVFIGCLAPIKQNAIVFIDLTIKKYTRSGLVGWLRLVLNISTYMHIFFGFICFPHWPFSPYILINLVSTNLKRSTINY